MQSAKAAATAAHFLGTSDRAAVLESWKEGVRMDARRPQQLRELTVEFPVPTDRNQAVVTLGQTVVAASVVVELVEPSPFTPNHGFFDINVKGVDASPASQRSPMIVEVRTAIDAILRAGGAVDTESLSVLPGRYVWSVNLTLTVLSDEGNVVDVASWAAVAALRHARRLDLTVAGESVTTHTARERDPVPLALHHIPISVSAAVLPDGFVLDPTTAEAGAAACCVTVGLTPSLQVCAVHKRSGAPCDYATVQAILAVGKNVVCGVDDAMTAAMDADEKKRKEAARARFEWARKRAGVARQPAAPATTA
jgi:exosome complex component RRP45